MKRSVTVSLSEDLIQKLEQHMAGATIENIIHGLLHDLEKSVDKYNAAIQDDAEQQQG